MEGLEKEDIPAPTLAHVALPWPREEAGHGQWKGQSRARGCTSSLDGSPAAEAGQADMAGRGPCSQGARGLDLELGADTRLQKSAPVG